jgi:transcription elongation factor Elf1
MSGASMRGSGIYSEDVNTIFYCSTCEDEFELDGTTDDYGMIAYATCPTCGKDLEADISDSSEPDPDAAYEAYKESLLD